MHSTYCDGKSELMDYVDQARKLNMISIGFSSHAPVPFPTKWCMKAERFDDYLINIEKIKKLNSFVEIYKGLEVDFIPGVTSPNLFRDKLDYTVGSIHFIEKFPDGTPWEIDGTHALFLKGYSEIFNNNIQDVITRYFELTREMIATACPSIVGHLDKIKIQNPDNKFYQRNGRMVSGRSKENHRPDSFQWSHSRSKHTRNLSKKNRYYLSKSLDTGDTTQKKYSSDDQQRRPSQR